MTKKISRKIRIQSKKHGGIKKTKPSKTTIRSHKGPKKMSPPMVSKLLPPNHNKLLSKVEIRPWQIFIADILNIEIKAVKGKKDVYLYFDKVSEVSKQKEVYSGRKKGVKPTQVRLDENMGIPKIPGKYNLKGAQFKLNGKKGELLITGSLNTQWQLVA